MMKTLGPILALLLLAMMYGQTGEGKSLTEILDGVQGSTVINQAEVWGADNISFNLSHPWSALPESSGRLQLDPGEKYIVLILRAHDT